MNGEYQQSDRIAKLRIVLATAAFGLLGFFLEVGPVGNAFAQATVALNIQLPTLGFLAYLALAASAAVGLHLTEEEPRPKENEEETETGTIEAVGNGEMIGERVRVRPDLQQLLMFVTALGGYLVLKSASIAFTIPLAEQFAISPGTLVRALQFGFVYTALAWFVMWHFLRWYAARHQWVRLQEEMVGVNVTRLLAVVILIKPVVFFIGGLIMGTLAAGPQMTLAILLHLTLVAVAVILWVARPEVLGRSFAALSIVGVVIIILTLVLVYVEQQFFA